MERPLYFAHNLRRLREAAGMKQNDLAKLLFVSFQTVSAWERGVNTPDLMTAVKLAELFGITLDTLVSDPKKEYLIGVDAGGTKTEIVLCDRSGRMEKRSVLPGANPNDRSLDATLSLLAAGLDSMMNSANVAAVFVGAGGAGTGGYAEKLASALRERYLIPVDAASDAANLLALCPDQDAGAVVICGTGSVVFVRTPTGDHRVGGWGYLFDEKGSAYDVGKDTVRHALAVKDALVPPSALSEALREATGKDVWDALPDYYARGRAAVAALAPLTARLAAEGDGIALGILRENAERLASLMKKAASQYPVPDAFLAAGGFFRNRVYLDLVQEISGIPLDLTPLPPVCGAVLSAARMAGEVDAEAFCKNFKDSYEAVL